MNLVNRERTSSLLKTESPEVIISRVVSKLSGSSSEWAQSAIKQNDSIRTNAEAFLSSLENFCQPPLPPLEQLRKFLDETQGNLSIETYARNLQQLYKSLELDNIWLTQVFKQGLNDKIKTGLILRPVGDNFENLVNECLLIEDSINHVSYVGHQLSVASNSPSPPIQPVEVPPCCFVAQPIRTC